MRLVKPQITSDAPATTQPPPTHTPGVSTAHFGRNVSAPPQKASTYYKPSENFSCLIRALESRMVRLIYKPRYHELPKPQTTSKSSYSCCPGHRGAQSQTSKTSQAPNVRGKILQRHPHFRQGTINTLPYRKPTTVPESYCLPPRSLVVGRRRIRLVFADDAELANPNLKR